MQRKNMSHEDVARSNINGANRDNWNAKSTTATRLSCRNLTRIQLQSALIIDANKTQ